MLLLQKAHVHISHNTKSLKGKAGFPKLLENQVVLAFWGMLSQSRFLTSLEDFVGSVGFVGFAGPGGQLLLSCC